MADYSTVRVETAFDINDYYKKQDEANLTGLFMPGFAIFALYLLISSNILYPLISCQVREMFEENMFLRHLCGYLSLLFFIVLSGAKDVEYLKTIVFTFFIYIWFVMTSHMGKTFWLISLFLFATLFVLQLYKTTTELPQKEKDLITDIEYFGTAIAFIVTAMGFTIYLGEKRIEYGSKFNFNTFLLGVKQCRGKSPQVSTMEAFRAAFKF
jgi:hypothetical protein